MKEQNLQVNCIITSPPYWAMRKYDINYKPKWDDGFEGELGSESNFDLYIKHLCDIFDLAKEVLREDGSLWINIGDTYSTQGGQNRDTNKDYSHYDSIKLNNRMIGVPIIKKLKLPSKCLCMIPERFAIEMINRGWILRNVIIWHKGNCMPSSVKDRFTVDFEYLYFFVKNRKYYFEQQFEKSTTQFQYSKNSKKGGIQDINNPRNNWGFTEKELKTIKKYKTKYNQEYGQTYQGFIRNDSINTNRQLSKKIALELYPNNRKKQQKFINYVHDHDLKNFNKRNKRVVWKINTKGSPEAHFAIFPEELVKTPIKAGCPKNGIVLDPFAGIGTTLKTTWKLGRNYIGFEISKKYCNIIEKNLQECNNRRLDEY